MTGSHLETCSHLTVQCSNDGCEEKFPRWMNSMHLTICDYQMVHCRYVKVGCDVKLICKDMKIHEEDDRLHLRIMAESVLELKKEVVKLTNEVSQQRIQLKKQTSKVAPIIFRLDKFEESKTKNEVYYSAPFYTSKQGYKFCVRVDCNGDGEGKGTHVSVFICHMKGDNDDYLTWPFTGIINIKLLNQLEDKNHHTMSITFQPDAEHNGRAKGRQKGEEWGYHFIPHTDLDLIPKRNCQYLKDDTLVFRVSAHGADYKPWLECN